ncbi:MAG: hypothetical protein ACPG6V_04575 [Flavobacteriales bacterium]
MKNIALILLLFYAFSGFTQNFELGESVVGYDFRSSFICFTNNDSVVLSGTFKGEIEKWDVSQQTLLNKIKVSNKEIEQISFHESSNTFYVSTHENEVLRYNFSTFEQLSKTQFEHPIHFIYQNLNNPCFVALNNGELYEISDSTKTLVLKSSTSIESLLYSKKSKILVVNDGKSIKTIHAPSQRVLKEVLQPTNSWFTTLIPYQGKTDVVISISENGNIHFWDLKKGELIKNIRAKNNFFNRGINKHSRNLIAGFFKNKSLLFSLDDYNLEFDLNEEIEISQTLVCSKDQKFIITADQNHVHKLYHLVGDQEIPKLAFQKRDLKLEPISLNGPEIEIEIWDHEEVDGDRISLNLNNYWLCRNHLITGSKRTFYSDLKPGANTLLFHAENLGKFPPNTCAIRITCSDGQIIERIMRSDLKETSGLTIQYNP